MTGRRGRPAEGAVIEVGMGALLAVVAALALLGAIAWLVLRRDAPATPGGPVVPSGGAAPAGGAGPGVTPEPGSWITPEGDPALGSPRAPVTLVEYFDFQCPNCRQFAVEVLPWLRTTWIERGVVRVVLRDYAIRGTESYQAAEAAWCAAEQGRYWSFHDALFRAASGENQGAFAVERLEAIAAGLGLDGPALRVCVQSGRHRGRVAASTQAAAARGFEGTPTYEVNGRQVQGAIPVDRWEELFQAFLADFARATESAGAAPGQGAGAGTASSSGSGGAIGTPPGATASATP